MPLLWISLAFISGIVLASAWSQPVYFWFMLAGISFLSVQLPRLINPLTPKFPDLFTNRIARPISKFVRRFLRWIGRSPTVIITKLSAVSFLSLLFIVFFLGAARYQISLPTYSPDFIAWYNDSDDEMVITGILVVPPDIRDSYINLQIEVEYVRVGREINRTAASGRLLARAPIDGVWHYGDRLILRGGIETPPENEDFSYRNYLANQGIYSFMPYASASLLDSQQGNPVAHAIFVFKAKALDIVYRLFPDPEASLFAGILLGVESGISADVKNAFNETGTTHIIAISGFNIAILAALFTKYLSRWLGVRNGALLAVLIIAVYALMVGGDAAVVRAAIMAWLALLAREIGRRQAGINSLAFVAAVMALFSPHVIWDVGFQLSFFATLGLVMYAQPFSAAFNRLAAPRLSEETLDRIAKPVSEYVLFTVAATVTTLPIIIYHFQRFSLISLPANLAILPAQPAIMVVGGIATLLAFVSFPLGQLVAYIAWPFAAFTIRVVEWFASIPVGTLLTGQVSFLVVLVLYVMIFAMTISWRKIPSHLPSVRPGLIFLVVGLSTLITWQSALSAPDGLLHIAFLDVGTGDAVLIKSPTGRYILIGGGPSSTKLSDALGRRLPIFDRKLDFLVIAAPREEQVAALPAIIPRFPPDQVLWVGVSNASRSARFLQSRLTEAAIPIIVAQTGDVLELGGGAQLLVVSTGRRGAVLLLKWDNFSLLLPLGLDFNQIEELRTGKAIGPVSALILADNGYAPLNPEEWIINLKPELIILGIAAGNYDGLPSQDVLQYINEYSLKRTDQNGWISLLTDGTEMWVEVERAWEEGR